MGSNSLPRRLVKRALRPLMNDTTYRWFQAAAMAWDIRSRRWYEPELDIIRHAVRAGDVVLDVGANYGLYAWHLERAVGASGKVIAFEPVAFTASTLALVGKFLGFRNVEIVEKGLSDTNGRVRFEVPLQDSGAIAAGLAFIGGRKNDREGKERHARFGATKEIECEVTRLDDFLAEKQPTGEVTFLKCDIEGAELLAFRGGEKTIDRDLPTVVCEINPWFLEGFGITLGDLLAFFDGKGYRLYWYDDQARRLEPRRPDQVVEDNYVFVHPRRASRLAALLG